MNVFDASALLAFLQGEEGAATVERELLAGGVCGAANWSEVAQKVMAHGGNWHLAAALLASYPLEVEPVARPDAEAAAASWERVSGLSPADRLCLALGDRLAATVWTADRGWGRRRGVRHVR